MNKSLKSLPLFPLNTVLFPGMVLPLHIFEPRYRIMIGECLRTNQPFGVVLIREGQEVGGPARTYAMGTSAYITQVEHLPDERMNIQTVGYQRFRIHSLQPGKPYTVGLVEDVPLPGEDDPSVAPISRRVLSGLKAYLRALQLAGLPALAFDEIPEDGRALALLTAIILPLQLDEKQELLEAADLPSMLQRQESLLRREQLMISRMLAIEQDPIRRSPFSAN